MVIPGLQDTCEILLDEGHSLFLSHVVPIEYEIYLSQTTCPVQSTKSLMSFWLKIVGILVR